MGGCNINSNSPLKICKILTIALVKPIKIYCPLISIDAVDTLAPTVDIPIGMVQLPA